MAGCCPSRDYHRFFNQRFARRLANRYRKRGLDTTAQKTVEFLQQVGIQGASVLEIGGGVGEIQIELLKLGAARAQNLELSPAYEQQARMLAGQAGVQGRLEWRIHDLAEDPGAVAPADLVVLRRVVCCYPDYQRLLAAAADHARRALVFSYPPRNLLSRAFYGVFNLVMRLTTAAFGVLPTRRVRCLRCSRIMGFGGRSSAAAESGRSPAWSASRKAQPRPARQGHGRKVGGRPRRSAGWRLQAGADEPMAPASSRRRPMRLPRVPG